MIDRKLLLSDLQKQVKSLEKGLRTQFFRDRPEETLRGWLEQGFDAVASTQAGKSLFDKRHNPLHQIPVSHDAAEELIGFWRRCGETDGLLRGEGTPHWTAALTKGRQPDAGVATAAHGDVSLGRDKA